MTTSYIYTTIFKYQAQNFSQFTTAAADEVNSIYPWAQPGCLKHQTCQKKDVTKFKIIPKTSTKVLLKVHHNSQGELQGDTKMISRSRVLK